MYSCSCHCLTIEVSVGIPGDTQTVLCAATVIATARAIVTINNLFILCIFLWGSLSFLDHPCRTNPFPCRSAENSFHFQFAKIHFFFKIIKKTRSVNKKLRSFTLSSPIFLPYFSHRGWEKYGRTDAEVWVNERTCCLPGRFFLLCVESGEEGQWLECQ